MKMRRIWLFSAFILVLVSCRTGQEENQVGSFTAHSEAFWDVVSPDALAERIGIRFEFTEGPAWHPDGTLLFSDIPADRIYRWNGNSHQVYMEPSGKSNGLLVLKDGTLFACEHDGRCLSRYSPDGTKKILADRYSGKRLNSPNDLCRSATGVLYFTDPPWGLPERNDDPSKELPFNGVFMLRNGMLSVIDSTLSWPNGIALSPDGNWLYVANVENLEGSSDAGPDVFWMRYRLDEMGRPVERSVFYRAPDPSLPGGPDGMKVDRAGNLFMTGPGGILVVSREGTLLGTIGVPLPPSNLAFGPREKELYITARSDLYRVVLD